MHNRLRYERISIKMSYLCGRNKKLNKSHGFYKKDSLSPCLPSAYRVAGRNVVCHHQHLRKRCPERGQPDFPAGYHLLLCPHRHGLLPHSVERLRTGHHEQHSRRVYRPAHPAHHRCPERHLDGQRRGAHLNILWDADYPSRLLPGLDLPHLCPRVGDDGQLVDNHCHHRHRPDGHRQGTGLPRRLDSRSHHLGGLLRRQGFSPVGHDHPGIVGHGYSTLHPHPLHDDYHRSLAAHCRHPVHRHGTDPRRRQHRARDECLCRHLGRQV